MSESVSFIESASCTVWHLCGRIGLFIEGRHGYYQHRPSRIAPRVLVLLGYHDPRRGREGEGVIAKPGDTRGARQLALSPPTANGRPTSVFYPSCQQSACVGSVWLATASPPSAPPSTLPRRSRCAVGAMSFKASKALMELRVHLCQSSAASKGIRCAPVPNFPKCAVVCPALE